MGVPPTRRSRVHLGLPQERHTVVSGCGIPALKRALDVAVATMGLLFALPLWCLIAIAIRLESRGPIFYRQERVGLGRRPFRMYKFRTMVADAERGTGPVWATDGDPRITRLGAILRSTHLDEVPQFLNVLRGEMSIVGPRPERPALVERLAASIPGYEDRCAVLPGITGLAQVRSGYDRSIGTVRRKLRYDRYYIRRRGCLSMDLRIMAATFMVMCQGAFVWRKPTTISPQGVASERET
ncbi:MAG: sugar transferase [Candidatus Eisenbacteria bacterium]|uniref:Sugar transferase n=1 Tax=Eiseniibacteriota bacterium TaxID=2212470 RepID=A0A538TC01_UNCEI|nr:MAG: sugar transferase [Candidatus Eisenbacteria bacterium]